MDEIVECSKCKFYKDGFCTVWKKKTSGKGSCGEYRVRLADHYVRNAWDEWKAMKEREEVGGKKR